MAKARTLAVAAASLLLALTQAARAGVLTVELTPFTGDSALVEVTFDDDFMSFGGADGDIQISAEVIPSPNIGDLRALYFHVADESLLGSSSVSGADVTSSAFGANAIIGLGGDTGLTGGGTPCPCDFGVEIGTSGIGVDDIQMTTFVLSTGVGGTDVSLFEGQDLGARVTSVGLPGGSRSGSSKLTNEDGPVPPTEVPEPGSLALLGLGLVAAGVARFRRRRD